MKKLKMNIPTAWLKFSKLSLIACALVIVWFGLLRIRPKLENKQAKASLPTETDLNGQLVTTSTSSVSEKILSANEAARAVQKAASEAEETQVVNSGNLTENGEISAFELAKHASSGHNAKNGDSLACYSFEQQQKLDKFFGPLPFINQLQIIRHFKVRGLYAANAENIFDLISLIKNSELNAVVINVKSDSYFHYSTQSKIARQANLSIEASDDLQTKIKQFKAAGIRVIGKISCFKDTLLARNYPDFAIKDRENRVINWANEGEASFVNPYNINVWRYLRDCCYEAIDLGCDELILDQVRFPSGLASNEVGNVYYGEKEDLPDKPSAISRFLEFMRVEISDKLQVPLTASLYDIHSDKGSEWTGQSYKLFSTCGIDSIAPNLFPADYANASQWYGNGVGTEINGQLFKAPDLDPYGVISATSNYYLHNFGKTQQRTFYRPYLQAFTAYYLPRKYWHEYTPLEIAKQIKALQDNGFTEYILWNNEASYSQNIFQELGNLQANKVPTSTTISEH